MFCEINHLCMCIVHTNKVYASNIQAAGSPFFVSINIVNVGVHQTKLHFFECHVLNCSSTIIKTDNNQCIGYTVEPVYNGHLRVTNIWYLHGSYRGICIQWIIYGSRNYMSCCSSWRARTKHNKQKCFCLQQ